MEFTAPIVLVVDDEPSIRLATARLLRSAGYARGPFESTQALFRHWSAKRPVLSHSGPANSR